MYAFVKPPASVPDVAGIEHAPLRAQPLDGLDAVVSDHDAEVGASEASILAHARVVEALADANDAVLPARFGGMHPDEERLREAAAGRRLEAALARVDGCVELGLRVLAPPPRSPTPTSGAAYMRARLERRRELDRVAGELHAPLARLSRDATMSVGTTPRLLLTAAYLVERNRVATFRETLAALEKKHADVGVVCTGPWPPYSFAIADGGQA